MSMTNSTSDVESLTKKDFVSDQDVRWCPGCGDYSVLNQVQRVFPTLGIPKENFVVISGIGCSSRFPYYMNTFGFHSIHGRAPAIATGVKCANDDLSVWVITGDGDGLSIGGNHLIHAIRRNLNLNILLINNQIYGLTKGQYSPTSEQGKITKSSPMGSIDNPINPLCLALASEASFVARTIDSDGKHMFSVLEEAAKHNGTSFVEIYQNCVIFNNGAFDHVKNRETKDDHVVKLQHGEPLLFGKGNCKGVSLANDRAEIVDISDGDLSGVTVHNEREENPSYAYALTQMKHPDSPVPIGVFRNVDRPVYNEVMEGQIAQKTEQLGKGDLQTVLTGSNTWEVE